VIGERICGIRRKILRGGQEFFEPASEVLIPAKSHLDKDAGGFVKS
jgi:hypothetical protein